MAFHVINTENHFRLISYTPLAALFLVFGCIMISIYLIFGQSYKTIFMWAVLSGGFLTRMVMAFSPTLYASWLRTFMFMYFAMIVCAVFVFSEIYQKKKVTASVGYGISIARSTKGDLRWAAARFCHSPARFWFERKFQTPIAGDVLPLP